MTDRKTQDFIDGKTNVLQITEPEQIDALAEAGLLAAEEDFCDEKDVLGRECVLPRDHDGEHQSL